MSGMVGGHAEDGRVLGWGSEEVVQQGDHALRQEQVLVEIHLAVLKVVEGVTGVNTFGKEGSGKQYGVFLWVRTHPEADRVPIRVACSSRVGTTKLDAALEAKQRVADALGGAALEAAEERVRIECAAAAAAAAPPSAFERMAAAQHDFPY